MFDVTIRTGSWHQMATFWLRSCSPFGRVHRTFGTAGLVRIALGARRARQAEGTTRILPRPSSNGGYNEEYSSTASLDRAWMAG
jgi:hypothetical protein